MVRIKKKIVLPENVNTQQELPTGAPNRRFLTGASVSCQVHHRNFAPVSFKNIFQSIKKLQLATVFLGH